VLKNPLSILWLFPLTFPPTNKKKNRSVPLGGGAFFFRTDWPFTQRKNGGGGPTPFWKTTLLSRFGSRVALNPRPPFFPFFSFSTPVFSPGLRIGNAPRFGVCLTGGVGSGPLLFGPPPPRAFENPFLANRFCFWVRFFRGFFPHRANGIFDVGWIFRGFFFPKTKNPLEPKTTSFFPQGSRFLF